VVRLLSCAGLSIESVPGYADEHSWGSGRLGVPRSTDKTSEVSFRERRWYNSILVPHQDVITTKSSTVFFQLALECAVSAWFVLHTHALLPACMNTKRIEHRFCNLCHRLQICLVLVEHKAEDIFLLSRIGYLHFRFRV
jgi:hypothetical protein